MGIHESKQTFHGLTVKDFDADASQPAARDLGAVATRIRLSHDEVDSGKTFTDRLTSFLGRPGSAATKALVIGMWNTVDGGDSAAMLVETLVSVRARLPSLEALFIGDITSEENEISWIEQTDVSAIWGAYPGLLTFGVRGGNGLGLGRIRHRKLTSLIVETGGLPRRVVAEVAAADLPALEHLELWLGADEYGGDARREDLDPILKGDRFPKLVSLALRDCAWGDVLAAAIVKAPLLARLRRLDLSLGTLGDAGASILAASPAVARLERLDIHHHYVSPDGVARLKALGIEVNAEGAMEPDSWDGTEHRYVAVSE